MSLRSARIGLAVAVPLLAASLAYPQTYNAVTGFELSSNVGTNLWSYWGSSNDGVKDYGSTISLLSTFYSDCGEGTQCWDTTSGRTNLVLLNVTGVNQVFGEAISPNDEISFYTRSGISLVRFLVPSSGTYSIAGFFQGIVREPTASEDVVAINERVISLTPELAFGAAKTFRYTQTLSAGDTVDFFVAGDSAGGTGNSMATGFNVTISDVPGATAPESSSLKVPRYELDSVTDGPPSVNDDDQ
jgi:hypothetical protein